MSLLRVTDFEWDILRHDRDTLMKMDLLRIKIIMPK